MILGKLFSECLENKCTDYFVVIGSEFCHSWQLGMVQPILFTLYLLHAGWVRLDLFHEDSTQCSLLVIEKEQHSNIGFKLCIWRSIQT